MVIYYRGPDVQITHRDFIRVTSPLRTFAIRHLRDVYVMITDEPGFLFGRRPSYGVYALYHGHRVCLFRTLDLRRFGQVKRALVRALEKCSDNEMATTSPVSRGRLD
jgi:hypothetical protein